MFEALVLIQCIRMYVSGPGTDPGSDVLKLTAEESAKLAAQPGGPGAPEQPHRQTSTGPGHNPSKTRHHTTGFTMVA